MRYSVGEVAHLLNMTPSALRFYESQNIVHAEKSNSGRRFYSQGDLARLISCKKYGSMEIPIKIIAGQFQAGGDSRQAIAGRLWQKSAEIEEKARYYQQLSVLIREQAQHLDRIDECLSQFSVSIREGCYLFSDPKHQLMSREKDGKELVRQWIQASPAVKISAIHTPEEENQTVLAYLVSESYASQMNLPLAAAGVQYLPPSVCVQTIISLRDSFFRPDKVFTTTAAYLDAKAMKQEGVATAALLVVESLEDGHYQSFFEIMVPFYL